MQEMNYFIYIVYGQDMEGRDTTPYYFLNEKDACLFAIKNTGRIGYGVPRVIKVEIIYDINNLGHEYYGKAFIELCNDTIFQYEEDTE